MNWDMYSPFLKMFAYKPFHNMMQFQLILKIIRVPVMPIYKSYSEVV